MKRNTKSISGLVATLLTVIAMSVATSACFWYGYQPEEPKCLREE